MRNTPISTRLQRTRRRFKPRTRKRGSPIRAALWASAVELAKDYGLYRTTQALRLEMPPISNSPSTGPRKSLSNRAKGGCQLSAGPRLARLSVSLAAADRYCLNRSGIDLLVRPNGYQTVFP
jgi:hypothetical protein